MKRKLGFTLIELLVVIAIISILAAIVVPNVNNWIARARMTNTVAEVQGIELAMTQMLNDAQRQNGRAIFDWFPTPQELRGIPGSEPPHQDFYGPDWEDIRQWLRADENPFRAEVELYTRAFYALLRQGRNAGDPERADYAGAVRLTFGQEGEDSLRMWVRIDPNVRPNLGTSYMDIGTDPWDNRFRIWPGPWNRERQNDYGPQRDEQSDENRGVEQFLPYPDATSRFVPIPFRSFREGGVETGYETPEGEWIPFQYTSTERDRAEQDVPGNPRADNRYGFPAPDGQQFYIYSTGADGESNQNYRLPGGHIEDVYAAPFDIERIGGGDDINNWDNQQGWSRWYTN